MKKAVVISIIVALAVLGGFFAKWKYDAVMAATSQGVNLGKAYGKTTVQSNCMLGLKENYAACGNTDCESSARGYIAACMNVAKEDDFCTGVPSIQEAKQALDWASKTCSEHHLDTDSCPNYMQIYISICTLQAAEKAQLSEQSSAPDLEKSAQ